MSAAVLSLGGDDSGRRATATDGGVAATGAARAFGLVLSPTSDRNTELRIERFASRYRRLRKNVITSARLLRDGAQRDGFRTFMAMLTLTYAPDVEWQPNHMPELQKRIRGWLRYRGHDYAYVWVCEL